MACTQTFHTYMQIDSNNTHCPTHPRGQRAILCAERLVVSGQRLRLGLELSAQRLAAGQHGARLRGLRRLRLQRRLQLAGER